MRLTVVVLLGLLLLTVIEGSTIHRGALRKEDRVLSHQRTPAVVNHRSSIEENRDAETTPCPYYMDLFCQEFYTICSGLSEHDVIAFCHLEAMNKNLTVYVQDTTDAAWEYNTDLTSSNAQDLIEASTELNTIYRTWWEMLINPYSYENLTAPWVKRQFEIQQSIGTAILEGEDLADFNNIMEDLTEAYNNKICEYEDTNCDVDEDGLTIDDLEILMAETRDYSELNYYWAEWREASGNEVVEEYYDYVFLMNKAARMNGFQDAGEMWIQPYLSANYTMRDFKMDIEALWQQLKPFYEKLHAYVRYQLMKDDEYEDEFEEDDDPIPASILGNMWAQDWTNIYDLVAPYNDELIDISDSLSRYSSVDDMFRIAEDFFTSMGLYPMTEDFWNNSMLEQPDGKEVVCHASAWDFFSVDPYLPGDGRFRIKMCTHLNQEDFITIHHEMGHTEYQMSYAVFMNSSSDEKPQFVNPLIYRDGANPGFHEAIGDTIALSVSTQSHLAKINANLTGTPIEEVRNLTYEETINFLMKQALSKIAFLPFAYILDLWRWEVFAGDIRTNEYNWYWWKKRLSYQGLRPPTPRTPDTDFDIGCKYHVLYNVPYIRYFVAHILQFQFHERLCELAGRDDVEIFNCDIYGSKEAGQALFDMMHRGRSVPWQKQLADFLGTNEGKMDATAILNYFGPLIEFLDGEIERLDLEVGWPTSNLYLEEYIVESEDISPIVPVVVGAVLIIMVILVLIAFFVGHAKRRRMPPHTGLVKETSVGQTNEGFDSKEETKSMPPPASMMAASSASDHIQKEKYDEPYQLSPAKDVSEPEIVVTQFPVEKEPSIKEPSTKDEIFEISPFEQPTKIEETPKDIKEIEEVKEQKIEEVKEQNIGEVKEQNIGEVKEHKIEEVKDQNIDVKEKKIEEVKEQKIDEVKEQKIDEVKDQKIDEVKEQKIDEVKEQKIDEVKEQNIEVKHEDKREQAKEIEETRDDKKEDIEEKEEDLKETKVKEVEDKVEDTKTAKENVIEEKEKAIDETKDQIEENKY